MVLADTLTLFSFLILMLALRALDQLPADRGELPRRTTSTHANQVIVDLQERIDLPTQVLIIPTALPRIEDRWSPCRISAVNLEDS